MSPAPSVVEGRRRTSHRQFSADRDVYISHTIKCNALQSSVTMAKEGGIIDYEGPGLLTETQRRYLHDEIDVVSGSQRERTIRSRIRQRVENLIQDVSMCANRMEDRDIKQIADKSVLTPGIKTGEIISFILNFSDGFSINPNNDDPTGEMIGDLEESIKSAVAILVSSQGYHAENLSVEICFELGGDIDALAEREPESLTESELGTLFAEDKITKDELLSEGMRRGWFEDTPQE